MKQISVSLACALVFFTAALTPAQNLTSAEIFSKSVESMGSKEAIQGLKTLMLIGRTEFDSNSPQVKGGGRAVVVSDTDDLFFAISLNSPQYPFEKIGYFKTSVSLPFISQGSRSVLGSFLAAHEKIVSEGVLGGVLSLRWPLYHPDQSKVKAEAEGIKTIDGRKLQVVDYGVHATGSGDFQIKLFFDPDNFRHVRTEYRYRAFPADTTNMGTQNGRSMSYVVLSEDFEDFKNVDGLNLPFHYRLQLSSNSGTGSFVNTYDVIAARYVFNQKLAPDFFTFEPPKS